MPSDLMSAEFYKDPGAFFDAYGQTLEQNEVEHSLILSLIARALDKKITRLPFDAWFGVASSKNQPALIALQTPPHNLVLSRAYQSGAEDFLAETLVRRGAAFPGVVGPSDVAANFINAWSRLTNQQVAACMDQIIYSLKKVLLPPPVEGTMRFARPDEVSVIAPWIKAFADDALPKFEHVTEEEALTRARDMIGAQHIAVWDVAGKAVAMAGITGTPSLARITLAYTPPENRGKGFASAVVAHLSQHELEHGKKMCCLYADARNPVSNSIYRKIGYEFVSRSTHYIFENSAD